MAEERRSIEISYKANLKDLVSKLKQLPDITARQAKDMVGALDRQIKQAEKAAKKSSEATAKAAKATAEAARKGSDDLKNLGSAADQAEKSLDHMADQAGDADRGFAALSLGLRQINPELAAAAEGAADFAAVGEGLVKGFKSLNPILLAATVAVASLTYGFVAYQEHVKAVKQLTDDYREALKKLKDEQSLLNDNLNLTKDLLRDQSIKYLELTGQISAYSAAIMKAESEVEGQYSSRLDAIDLIIKKTESEILLIRKLQNGAKNLSDADKDRLKTLQLQNVYQDQHLDLTKKGLVVEAQLDLIKSKLNDKLKSENDQRSKIEKAQNKATEMQLEVLELQKEYTEETEKQAAKDKAKLSRAERLRKAEEARLKAVQEILNTTTDEEKVYFAKLKMQEKLFNLTASEQEIAIQGINDRYDLEFAKMGELYLINQDNEAFKAVSQEMYKARAEEIHQIEMDQIKERRDALIRGSVDASKSFAQSIESFAQTKSRYLEDTDQATEESMQKLFKLQQGAAVANIAMTTAENIVKAAGMGPAAPLLIAAAVTAGAAQTAAVLAQQPPTLHMGGIAPDERTTILSGEAVLDRTTTRRLGAEGVRELQNNQGGGAEVIVLQPFKHFDRFTKASRAQAGRRAGSGRY